MLPPAECRRLLAVAAKGDGLGRLAVATDQAPVVIPINFVLADHDVMVRTGTGFISQAAAGRLVAFEVDHLDLEAGTAWSVLVRGLATLVESPDQEQLAAAPHPLVPDPGGMLLVIRPDVITGRRFQFPKQP